MRRVAKGAIAALTFTLLGAALGPTGTWAAGPKPLDGDLVEKAYPCAEFIADDHERPRVICFARQSGRWSVIDSLYECG